MRHPLGHCKFFLAVVMSMFVAGTSQGGASLTPCTPKTQIELLSLARVRNVLNVEILAKIYRFDGFGCDGEGKAIYLELESPNVDEGDGLGNEYLLGLGWQNLDGEPDVEMSAIFLDNRGITSTGTAENRAVFWQGTTIYEAYMAGSELKGKLRLRNQNAVGIDTTVEFRLRR